MTKGAEYGDTNGLAGSRAAQITIPCVPDQISIYKATISTYNEAVNKPLNQEQVPQIVLRLAWKRAQDACGPTIEHRTLSCSLSRCCIGRNLLVVLAHENETSYERSEDLGKDVHGHFLPWKALPIREANRDSRVEVASGSRRTGDNGERYTNGIGPANLEQGSKYGLRVVEEESSRRSNSGIHVEEDASSFGHHFTKPSGPAMLEIEFAL